MKIIPHHEKKILSIHYLRAIAAILIVCIHAIQFYPGSLSNESNPIILSIYDFGGIGVDIFFIISGFLMFYINTDTTKPSHFILNRIHRVVPLYWFWSIVFFAMMSALSPKWIPDFSHLAKSLLFIPAANPNGGFQPTLNVGWTLNHEVIFHVVFFLSLFLYPRIRLLFISILIIVLAFFFNYRVILVEMIFGSIIYIYHKRLTSNIDNKIPLVFIIISLLFSIALSSYAYRDGPFLRLIIWGTSSSAFFIGFLMLENYFHKNQNSSFFYFLKIVGDSSYSIYLTHWFWGFITYRLMRNLEIPEYTQVLITIFTMLFSGIILFYVVEKKILLLTSFMRPRFVTLDK